MNKQHQPGQGTGDIWSQYLQRRVMRLLLLHDQHLFRSQFAHFFTGSSLPALPVLQFYERYIKLLTLGDELLNHILPRIRLQLSLQTDLLPLQEEAPTRGEIDWSRTIARAINETPDLPPQLFETRQRQQHIKVPENLLFVAILLQHQQIVRGLLKKDQSDELLTDAERQQLVNIDESIERELATPDARLLRETASRSEIEQLVEQVTARLRPGAGPYRDLLAWWEHFNALHIGQSDDQRRLTLASTRKNEQDAWLYELWIALELLTLLQEKHQLDPETVAIQNDLLSCTFTWQEQRYHFSYQRGLSPTAGIAFGWEQVPAVQPTYRIERENPVKVEADGAVVWQEPPFVLAATYASERQNPHLGAALQQVLGSMQILQAHEGILFFPLLADPIDDQQCNSKAERDEKIYTDRINEQTSVQLYKMTPDMPGSILQQRLDAVLQHVIKTLSEREVPACHGVMLDPDSINSSQDSLYTRNVLCPKPHIGKGVFDLVNKEIHCLKDPRMCHAIGRAIFPPRTVRTTSLADLKHHIEELRAYGEEALKRAEQTEADEKTEQLSSEILRSVGTMVEQYVQMRGNTTAQEKYFKDGIFGIYWKQHPRCLSEETRNILLSGEFVWDEYEGTNLQDWAAPAVQYCRALESEIKRRIHDYYPDPYHMYPDITLKGFDVPRKNMTLGAIETIYKFKDKGEQSVHYKDRDKVRTSRHNWLLCTAIAERSGSHAKALEAILRRMVLEHVSDNRNELAHGKHIPYRLAQELRDTIIGRKDKPGILLWLAENLEPKR